MTEEEVCADQEAAGTKQPLEFVQIGLELDRLAVVEGHVIAGLEVGTVGGGTTLPYARAWLGLMDCAGPGKVYRFAQIVAAATLALEISASSAMATSGSENFFKAHFERGGLR